MQDLSKPFAEIVATPDPLVSVIVPTYNKADFLAESVQSVLDQTYKNLEIVIVNDGSTDNSAAVAKGIQEKHPSRRFTILDKQNGGISDARNYAIERCAGRIVCCLDGDDLMQPTFIEKGLAGMRIAGANLVCCDVEIFGAETGEWIPDPFEQYAERYNNNIPTLVMYDKALWARSGGYSVAFPFNEDWEFSLRLTRHGLTVLKLNEKLFRYRVTEAGLAQNYIKDSWDQSVSLIVTNNPDLYPVEHVLAAHKNLGAMRDNWAERFARHSAQHPKQWLLRFWMGLALEGKNQATEAFNHYVAASDLAGGPWQVLFRIAGLIERENKAQAATLLHAVRILRPDMTKHVEERIKSLTNKK